MRAITFGLFWVWALLLAITFTKSDATCSPEFVGLAQTGATTSSITLNFTHACPVQPRGGIYSNYRLWRAGSILIKEFEYNPGKSPYSLVDNGGTIFGKEDGLEPGTVYSYSIHFDSGSAEASGSFCTVPARPTHATYYAINTTSIGISVVPDAFHPAGSSNFNVTIAGSSIGFIRIDSPSTDGIFSQLSPYTAYTVEVQAYVNCSDPTFAPFLYSEAFSFTAYTAPNQPSISIADTNATCVAYTITADHVASSDVTYQLFRDDLVVNSKLTAADLTGYDCNLTPGTQYEYKVSVFSQFNNFWNVSMTTSDCTLPASAMTLTALDPTTTNVSVSWAPGRGGVTHYYISMPRINSNEYVLANESINYTSPGLPNSADIYNLTVQSVFNCSATNTEKMDPNPPLIELYTRPNSPQMAFNDQPGASSDETILVEVILNSTDTANPTNTSFDVYRDGVLIQSDLSPFNDVTHSNGNDTYVARFLDTVTPASNFIYTAVTKFRGYESDPTSVPECSRPTYVSDVQFEPYYHLNATITWAPPARGDFLPDNYSVLIGSNIVYPLSGETKYEIMNGDPNLPHNGAVNIQVIAMRDCSGYGPANTITVNMPPHPPDVTCGAKSSTSVSLNIQLNSTNNANSPISMLLLQNGTFISETPETNITEQTALTPGYQYSFKAVIIQNDLQSQLSAECLVCPTPEKPLNVVAKAEDDTSITVYFDAPAGNFDGFNFSDGTNTFMQSDNTIRSYTFTGLASETSYNLVIQTFVSCYLSSSGTTQTLYANETATITAYTAPAQLNFTLTTLTASVLQLTFGVTVGPGPYTYYLWRDGIKIVDGSSIGGFTDTGLKSGTMYNYTGAVEANGVLSVLSHWVIGFTNPDVVSNVELIAATHSSLTLKWIPPRDNVDGYLLTVDGWTNQNETVSSSANVNTATISTGIDPDTVYSINVYSMINHNNPLYPVQFSLPITANYRSSMAAPNISISQGATATALSITFLDGKLDGEIMERVLYRINPSGEFIVIKSVTNTYNDPNLQYATQYTYYTTYVGLNGFESAGSKNVTWCTDPQEPIGVHLSSFDAATPSYELSWQSPQTAPTYYNVNSVGSTSNSITNVATVTSDISTIVSSTAQTYAVSVTSVYRCSNANPDGSSPSSTVLLSDVNTTIVVYTAPGQPTSFTLTSFSSSSIQIDVTLDSADVDKANVVIDVYRKLSGTEQGLVVDDASPPQSPIYDTHELDPGTLYTYYIHAVYNNMASVATSESSMCTKPAEPLQVRIDMSAQNDVTIKWNAPIGGITGYEVRYNGSLFSTVSTTEVVVTSLGSDTYYNFTVRTTFLCSADSQTKYSDFVPALTYTRPEKPVIASAVPTSTTSIQLNFTTNDNLADVTFTIFNKGVEVGTVSGGSANFDHTGQLAGTENNYTVTSTIGEYTSLVSDPVVGCSYPARPTNLYFTPVDASSVQFRWTYPPNSAPDAGNVFYDITINGSLDQNNYNGLQYVKGSLGAMESFNFTIETVLVCDATGIRVEYDSSVAGTPVMQWAYTKPSDPVLALDGTSTVSVINVTLENPGSNSWISPYDKIRLFRDGFVIDTTTSSLDPYAYSDTGLTPSTQYRYETEVTWNRLTAFSATPLYECTYPEVVQNVRVNPHSWYGINLRWQAPVGNTVTGFQIKINITGENLWADLGYNFEYSFRNPDTPDDVEFTDTSNNLFNFFNSKLTTGVKSLAPNTAYGIEIRAYFNCTGQGATYEGEAVTVVGMTAPYPPKNVILTPVDNTSISIGWTAETSPQPLLYDIYQCDTNYTTCTRVAQDLSSQPYVVTSLTHASFYCFDVRAKWNGIETSVLDRKEWLDDYQDYLNNTDQHTLNFAYFYETHLTFTNYTHAYYDALCSCTYPPVPLTINWHQYNSSAIHYNWTMPDLTTQRREWSHLTGHFLTMFGVGFYDNSAATEIEMSYDTLEHIFGGFNPIESHQLQIKSRLVCPDRRATVADADTTVLDSSSLDITAWTRPTIPTFTTITQVSGNPDEEISITYSTPDAGTLHFHVERDFSNVGLNATATTQNDVGLTSGTVYNYTVLAQTSPTAGVVLVSITSDPTEGCTLPADIPWLNKSDVDNVNSVVFTWGQPPNGSWLGYNFTSDSGTTFTFTDLESKTLTGLDWCTQWTFQIYSVGDCGSTKSDVLSENSQSLSHYLAPQIPSIQSTSAAVDDVSITVEWTDPNVALSCPTDPNILIYRDGVQVHDLTAPGSGSQVDSGLSGGTVYEYQISAKKGTDESSLSSVFVLCTIPTALTTADIQCIPDSTNSLQSKLLIDSNSSLYNFDIDITGDFTQTITNLDSPEFSLGQFVPGDLNRIVVTVTVLLNCPKTSGAVVLRSTSNPSVSLDCLTLPGQVTIRTESSSSDALSISWEHQGSSNGYQLRITPFVTTDNGGGSEVINTTATSYDFSGLDGSSVYTIEITNYYQGYASLVATLEYDSGQVKELLGLPFATGVIVIVVIAVVGILVIGGVAYLITAVVKKVMVTKATNGTVKPDNIETRGSTPYVDYTINKTYDLRAEYIAAQRAKKPVVVIPLPK